MDFSREQLQDKNLFELREIARENRVQSPTKLNKEELISQLVEASSQSVKGLKIRPVSRPSKLVDAPRRNAQNDVPDKAAESINEIMAVDDTCEEREGILEIHPRRLWLYPRQKLRTQRKGRLRFRNQNQESGTSSGGYDQRHREGRLRQ